MSKAPGIKFDIEETELDLTYNSRYSPPPKKRSQLAICLIVANSSATEFAFHLDLSNGFDFCFFSSVFQVSRYRFAGSIFSTHSGRVSRFSNAFCTFGRAARSVASVHADVERDRDERSQSIAVQVRITRTETSRHSLHELRLQILRHLQMGTATIVPKNLLPLFAVYSTLVSFAMLYLHSPFSALVFHVSTPCMFSPLLLFLPFV